MVVCSKSSKFWPNPWFFVFFHEMRHFLQLLSEKFIEMQSHGSLFEKLQSFGQIDDFSCFFTKWGTFCNLLLKSSSQHQNMVVCSKKFHRFGKIHGFSCFFTKWGTFCNFFLKSSSKCKDMVVCSKSCKVLARSMIFRAFSRNDSLFAEKSSIWPKLAPFRGNNHVSAFGQLFSKKLQKVAHFSKKNKNHPFGQNLQLFEETTMFRRFGQLFSKKFQKVAHFEKMHENHRFCQNLQLFEKTTMFRRFGHFFRKKSQKRAHFVKKHEKSSIWPRLATLRGNAHVSAFWSIFQQKKCKKWLISWNRTKHHRFGQKLQLFQETTMFPRFGQLFSKKVEKVAHFVKNDEKSSIWPNLATFRGNYHVSAFLSTFQQKVAKSGSFCEGARKIIDLAKTSNFTSKLPCFGLLVKFSEKSESFPEKARKIIDLAKTNNFSNKLQCFGVLVSFSAKSCKKYCRSISGTSYNYGVRDLNLLLSPLPRLR